MRTFNDVIDAWMRSERIRGVAFSLNESVRITAGEHAGGVGSVVSLSQLNPEAAYLVELSSGVDVQVAENQLLAAAAFDDAIALAELQRWYARQCDEDSEHSFGVEIGTLDNPGWTLTVDLQGTSLESRPFVEVRDNTNDPDWIACRVESNKFTAACAPGMLSRVARIFVDWAHAREASA